jgi:hypothetical protein
MRVGLSLLCAGVALSIGCSSSSAGTGTSGTGTSGGGSSGGTTSGTSAGSTGSSTSGGGTSAGASSGGSSGGSGTTGGTGGCPPPGHLHPPKSGTALTLDCPFSGVDGGQSVFCDPSSQHCCQYVGAPSSCQSLANPCTTGFQTDWDCADPVSDCPGGMQCCAEGATLVLGGTDDGGAPCANYAMHMKQTTCQAACTGVQMCSSDSECAVPQHCTAFTHASNQVGGCN